MKKNPKKLKEFDLDAPTLKWEERHAFRTQTRFLTSSVERNFQPMLNDVGAWKLLVEVVPSVTDNRTRNLLGVLTVQVAGDAAMYLALSKGKRESMALDWLLCGARTVFSENGWSIDGVVKAIQSVVDSKFQNVLVWKKEISNASKSAVVDVIVELDDEQAKIVAIFRSREGKREQAATLCIRLPSEFDYVPCLGTLTWLDDDVVQLTSRTGSESWTATRLRN